MWCDSRSSEIGRKWEYEMCVRECVSMFNTHQYFFKCRATSTVSFGLCPNSGDDEKEDADHAREECKCKEGSICGGRRALSTLCAAALSLVAGFARAAEAARARAVRIVTVEA